MLKLIVDVNTMIINRIEPKDILELYYREGVFLYDSTKGQKPFFVNDETEIKLIDAKSDEGIKLIETLKNA